MAIGLTTPGTVAPSAPTGPAPRRTSADRIRYFGDFELLQEIARGGMGIVYRARQVSLDRTVAVKLLPFGKFASDEFVRRFRAEAEAAAGLQHPNIVAIHEIGEHEGQPYFSMEYVEGQNLAERAKDNPLPPELAADYVRTIARATHYAHQHGVLHRDLKPSNVLIGASDQARITDFGLAKRLHRNSDLTLTGQVMGTPNFMAPEQASGRRAAVTIASDVYGLGTILYYLLTGRPPFVSETIEDTLWQVMNDEPVPPRQLNARVPRELNTVCLKCLEKDPRRRYASAQELSDDLGRWLRHEPILTRPSTRWEQFHKWAQRKPAIASLSALLLVGAGLGLPTMIWQWRSAVQARRELQREIVIAQRERERAEETLALKEIKEAGEHFAANDTPKALAFLAGVLRRMPTNQAVAAQAFSTLTQQVLAVPLTPALRHGQEVNYAEFSPDGRWVVTAAADGEAAIWDARTGELLKTLRHAGSVWCARFSSDSQSVVTASEDKTACVWNALTGEPRCPPLVHSGSVGYAYFTAAGDVIVTGTWDPDWTLRFWDARTGQPFGQPIHDVRGLRSCPFSRDGLRGVTSYGTNGVMIWNPKAGAALLAPLVHPAFVWSTEFSPDMETVLTACQDGAARFFNARTGVELGHPLHHGKPLWEAHYSRDGASVVTVCQDMTVQVWDAFSGRAMTGPVSELEPAPTWEARFTADGQPLAVCLPDGKIVVLHPSAVSNALAAASSALAFRTWPKMQPERPTSKPEVQDAEAEPQRAETILGPLREDRPVRFSPNSQMLVLAFGAKPQLLDAKSGRALLAPLLHAKVRSAEFASDSQRLVTASKDGTAQIWGIRFCQRWRNSELQRTVAPLWFPGLLEAIAQTRMDEHGEFHAFTPDLELVRISAALQADSDSNPWISFGRWLFADSGVTLGPPKQAVTGDRDRPGAASGSVSHNARK